MLKKTLFTLGICISLAAFFYFLWCFIAELVIKPVMLFVILLIGLTIFA